MATAAAPPSSAAPSGGTLFTRIRLATKADVPHIHKLVYQMAVFERLTHQFEATTASLAASLFPQNPPPPFTSFTVFVLEVSSAPFPSAAAAKDDQFTPLLSSVPSGGTLDPDRHEFISSDGGDAVVVGYSLFFPSYSPFLRNPGFHIEHIFVRERYRRKGLGKMLLSAMGGTAVKMGYGRLEWVVLDWNVNAVAFYEEMGAQVMPGWRICRITEQLLQAKYAHNSS